MTETKYIKNLFSSIKEVFKKPVLLLPFIYVFILSMLAYIFIGPIPYNLELLPSGTILKIALLSIIVTLISLAFLSMGISGIKKYFEEKKVTPLQQFKEGLGIYWKILGLRIIQIICVIAVLIVFITLYALIFSKEIITLAETAGATTPVIGGSIISMMIILVLLFLFMGFLFSNVLIAYRDRNVRTTIKESFNYLKNRSAHVFYTTITLVATVLVLLLLYTLMEFVLIKMNVLNLETILQVVKGVVLIPVQGFLYLFLFKSIPFSGAKKTIIEKTEKMKAIVNSKQGKIPSSKAKKQKK